MKRMPRGEESNAISTTEAWHLRNEISERSDPRAEGRFSGRFNSLKQRSGGVFRSVETSGAKVFNLNKTGILQQLP